MQENNLTVTQQTPIHVYYSDQVVEEYFADLLVSDLVIVELKAPKKFSTDHKAQLLNYLNATKFEVGLLLNFDPTPQIKRLAFENNRKTWWNNLNKKK